MKSENSLNFVNSRIRELMGVALILVAIFCAVALMTNHPLDPSFNVSKDGRIYNFAGKFGAYFSGPVLQAFGFAAYFYIIFALVWGLRLILKQEVSYFLLRIVAANISVFFLAAFFALFQVKSTWSYISYGGFAGSFLNSYFADKINFLLYLLLLWFVGAAFVLPSLKFSLPNFFKLHLVILFKLGDISYQRSKAFLQSSWQRAKHELMKKFFKNRVKDIDPTINKKKQKISKVTKEFKLQPSIHRGSYAFPAIDHLSFPGKKKAAINKFELSNNAKLLQQTLEDFGIKGKICDISPGPVVTLYEFEPAPGIKSARIIGLADDVARSMSAVSARISLLPAKNALGIELPNPQREVVFLRELLESNEYKKQDVNLPLALGKDIGGNNIIADLAKMPHLLVAGTTGSGKSVAINTMILSLMYRLSPEQCKFIMIDPKMLELSVYEGIPHLLSPVITEAKKAVSSLAWATQEMENRYRLMSALGVRNITGYNERITQAIKSKEVLTRTIQTGFDQDTGKPIFEDVELDMTPLPYIVLVIDEMADLMIVAGKEIESYLQRLAQMARASGIHLIIATQRPSVDVITGVIKANFPTRISFQVTSKIDSRTILGEQGAEQLLGMGDMLYMYSGSKILRVHGPFVSDNEVKDTVKEVKNQGEPDYIYEIVTAETEGDDKSASLAGEDGDDNDMFAKAVKIIVRDKKVSISYIQRQLRIGYNRAANIVEEMERQGIISAPNSNGKREILIEGND